jgi:hypothetical protein
MRHLLAAGRRANSLDILNQGWEFPTKNNSEEDGIDGTNGYFRQNSGCSAIGGTESSRNSVPNPSAEEKTTQNSVPLNKNRLSGFPSETFSGRENNWEFRSVEPK